MASIKFYAVTGTGFFPTDMLRYDNAEPMNTTERDIMESHIYDPECEQHHHEQWKGAREQVSICLMSDQRGAPTVDRWRSFGWLVTNVIWDEDGYHAGPLDSIYEY